MTDSGQWVKGVQCVTCGWLVVGSTFKPPKCGHESRDVFVMEIAGEVVIMGDGYIRPDTGCVVPTDVSLLARKGGLR